MKLGLCLSSFLALLLFWSCATQPKPATVDPRLEQFQTKVTDLQNQVTAREAAISDLNAKVSLLQADVEKYKDYQNQVVDLQKQLDSKNATIASLSAGDSKLQATIDASKQLQSQISELTKQLQAKNASYLDLQNQKLAQDIKMAKLTADFDQFGKRIAALQGANADLQVQSKAREADSANLHGQLLAATKANDDLNVKLSALKSGTTLSQASYIAQIDALNKSNAKLLSSVGDLNKQVADLTQLSKKDELELDARVADLSKTFAAEIAKGDIVIKRYRNVLVIDIQDSVLFPPDSPVLQPQNLSVLRTLAEVFNKATDKIVRVEGNTAVAISSAEALRLYPTSWHLGATRAANVVQFLQEQCGMDPHQLVVSSLGEYNPTASNSTEPGKAQNRRVEFVLVAQELWQLERLNAITLPKQ